MNIPLVLPTFRRNLTPVRASGPSFWSGDQWHVCQSLAGRAHSSSIFSSRWLGKLATNQMPKHVFSNCLSRHGQPGLRQRQSVWGAKLINILSATGRGRFGYQGRLYKYDWFMWRFSTALCGRVTHMAESRFLFTKKRIKNRSQRLK